MLTMTTWAAFLCSGLLLIFPVSKMDSASIFLAVHLILGVWLLWLFDHARSRACQPDNVIETASEPPIEREGLNQTIVQIVPNTEAGCAAPRPVVARKSSLPSINDTDDAADGRLLDASKPEPQSVDRERSGPSQPAPFLPGRALKAPRTTPDFKRHQHVPGWLYAAHNDLFRDGLFKLGYTTDSILNRMRTLNKEFKGSAHAGEFRALYWVHVLHAYYDEQNLFALLDQYRVSQRCEFFFLPLGFVTQAMNVISAKSGERSIEASELLHPQPRVPADLALVRRGLPSAIRLYSKQNHRGSLLILRNEVYRPGIYRLGHTTSELIEYKTHLDYEQRRRTSQVGFFSIIAAWSCNEPRRAWESVMKTNGEYRLGRTSFIEMPLERLEFSVEFCLNGAVSANSVAGRLSTAESKYEPISRTTKASHAQARRKDQPYAESVDLLQAGTRDAEPVSRRIAGEAWVTNTCPYPGCLWEVRVARPEGDQDRLRCGSCHRIFEFRVDQGKLKVWRDIFL